MTIANIVVVLLKMNATRGTANYITYYRPSLGLDRYATGSAWDILSFVLAALVVGFFGFVLSFRVYGIKRELSLVVLSLSLLLLVLLVVVGNALLVLR